MPYNRIDLHMHSTASDGELPPSEVVSLARQRHLDVIALTDHDCVDGLPEAIAAAEGSPLLVLPGIELATVQADGETIDLLGYLMDINDPAFEQQLATMRNARRKRAAQMVEKLAALGLPLALERVFELAGPGSVGRPHVARALLEAGYVSTRQQAFDLYIGNDGPAYVHHYVISIEDAIAMLHQAGGVAVLAHPYRVKRYDERIAGWAAAGLDGLEVYYPEHGPDFTLRARVIARKLSLIPTGGSDFHRIENGEVIMGTVTVPGESIERLLEKAQTYR